MSHTKMNREEWRAVLSLPNSALSPSIRDSISKHLEVIAAWVKGEDVHWRTGDQNAWVKALNGIMGFWATEEYQIARQVKITVEMNIHEAKDLYSALEDASFRTISGRAARTKLLAVLEEIGV